MKKLLFPFITILFLNSCTKELEFESKTFEKKTSLPCQGNICPHAQVTLPIAKDGGVISDSINNKVFSVMKEILYFGENPYDSESYGALVSDFIASYEKMQKENPDDVFGWEAEINGKVSYTSEKLIGIEIDHYTFTGGAHGYSGKRFLVFDAVTGKWIPAKSLFKDSAEFQKFAETRFRKQFNIAADAPINSGGLMFEGENFSLPETIIFTDRGLLLYYNTYEIASYAEGPQQLVIPYSDADAYLAVK